MIVLVGLAVVVVVVVLVVLAMLLLVTTAILGGQASASPGIPSQMALADIPAELLAIYTEAAKATCDMPWAVLAAVGKVETDHGRSTSPGVRSGANGAGAMGPMQFLGGTWATYGVDGDRDGVKDVYNPVDAIWGAANYLCASGAGDPARLRDAIWAYNHADWYVTKVLEQAATYEVAPALGSGNAADLLDNPNVSLTPNARGDLEAGIIDQRVIDFLVWAAQRHTIAVSVLKTGHSTNVAGTNRVSNHTLGRGADIYAVDGETVNPSSQAGRALAIEASQLAPPGRPDEMGVPWADLTDLQGVFTDGSHQNHIHVGWDIARS